MQHDHLELGDGVVIDQTRSEARLRGLGDHWSVVPNMINGVARLAELP
jgi:hypothetical protein